MKEALAKLEVAFKNAGLAFVAALAGGLAASSGAITKPVLVATAYAAARLALGQLSAALGKPLKVDK